MNNLLLRCIKFAALSIIFYSTNASAIPVLQLTIGGGTYDTTTATTVAAGNSFSLYALLTPANNASDAEITAMLADTYFVSAALDPKQATADTGLGSFTFGTPATTVNVTGDMEFGRPPAGAIEDLPTHSIFDTYFKEFSFQFSAASTATTGQSAPYDVANSPSFSNAGKPPTDFPGTGAYWVKFPVDVTLLNAAKSIHFDLYNKKPDGTIESQPDGFAPFSHDAQSSGGGDTSNGGGDTSNGGGNVPEPGSIALLGLGLLAGVYSLRRRSLQA